MKIEVRWGVDDGYAGGARPQSFKLDVDEMADSCDTEAEAVAYLHDEVEREFRDHIAWYLNNQDEVIEAWRAARASAT